MDKRHAEYVEYYRARLAKYEGNALYPHSEAAERALFEAISTASSLEEFRERQEQGQLALKCAIARVKDVEAAEAKSYQELNEPIRAQPSLEILQRLEASPPQTVEDLTTLVSETRTSWNLKISADEHLRDEFWGDWKVLEDIECDERAEVPERWRAERQRAINEELEGGAKHYRDITLPAAHDFMPEWQPDHAALWEIRHRRRFPIANDVLEEKITAHKRYWGID